MFSKKKVDRECVMDDGVQEFLNGLPEQFIVFSGNRHKNGSGDRWEMSYWGAKSLAQSLSKRNKGIITGICDKKNVCAVRLGRRALRLITRPETVKRIVPISKVERPLWIIKILDECRRDYRLGQSSFHGMWHWEKVELNVLALAKETPGCDNTVAWLFALIHDSKRENEHDDPWHGHRSAMYCKELFDEGKLKISKRQLSKLREACKYHVDGEISCDPTIGVCWDADRLDLIRVGIIPDTSLLSTKIGKKMVCKI